MTSLVDLPPTLLDAAGIAVPDEMQGRSILPLVRGTSVEWPKEAFIQISEAQVGRAIRTERWKYCVDSPDPKNWIDGQRGADRYVEQYLYDLQADPYELTNLVDLEAYSEIKTELIRRLLRWMDEVGESKPVIIEAETRTSHARTEWPSSAEDLGFSFRRPAGKI